MTLYVIEGPSGVGKTTYVQNFNLPDFHKVHRKEGGRSQSDSFGTYSTILQDVEAFCHASFLSHVISDRFLLSRFVYYSLIHKVKVNPSDCVQAFASLSEFLDDQTYFRQNRQGEISFAPITVFILLPHNKVVAKNRRNSTKEYPFNYNKEKEAFLTLHETMKKFFTCHIVQDTNAITDMINYDLLRV